MRHLTRSAVCRTVNLSIAGRCVLALTTVMAPACAALLMSSAPAAARTDGVERSMPAQSTARPTSPLKIIVSIRRQRVSVWDGFRKIAEAPISSGMQGHDTPTGVFSILQKNRIHHSNLYNDAPMPFMQRLTWSGVALHAGALPGYPASHGCIRLPYSFARQLFDITRVGARVIVAGDDIEPRAIASPKLPVPLPPTEQVAEAKDANRHSGDNGVGMLLGVRAADAAPARQPAYVPQRTRASVAAARAAELSALADAITKAQTERDHAEARAREAASGLRDAQAAVARARLDMQPLSAARDAALRGQSSAEALLKSFVTRNRNDLDDTILAGLARQEDEFEQRIEASSFEIHDIDSEIAERTLHIDALVQAVSVANWQQHITSDALAKTSAALSGAQAAKTAAERALKRQSLPISVFVSRKSGKVSVRQAGEPLFEAPVRIDTPEAPLGTHVFTALEFESGEHALSWSVVSIATSVPADARAKRDRDARGKPADTAAARPVIPQTAAASLARVHIPDDVLERLAEYLKPGSSFMISDLDVSGETGKGTDFVLLTR